MTTSSMPIPYEVWHERDSRQKINLRLARVQDAEFILGLRLQQHKTQYLSPVENNLAKQQAWLQSYQQKNDKA